MKIAIITGASSGLGIELLHSAVKYCPDIDTYWLIARRKERLEALAEAFPKKKIRAVPLDLTEPDSFDALSAMLKAENAEVALLINNAGMGKLCDFDTADRQSQLTQVDLNCRALTAVTHICLPFMNAGGMIVNISSIASFAPTPRMTVYCSTKAYVQSFSRALREELKPKGIHVLSVCPGPMDTEFLGIAGCETGKSRTFDMLPHQDPAKIADAAIRAALQGRSVCTVGLFYKFYRVLAHLLPKCILMKFTRC